MCASLAVCCQMAPPDGYTSQWDTVCHQLLFDDTNRERDTQECWMEGSSTGGVRCLILLSPKLTISVYLHFVRCGCASGDVFEEIHSVNHTIQCPVSLGS